MAEKIVFWAIGRQVYAGIVRFDSAGWSKVPGTVRNYGVPWDTPDEARKASEELNLNFAGVLA